MDEKNNTIKHIEATIDILNNDNKLVVRPNSLPMEIENESNEEDINIDELIDKILSEDDNTIIVPEKEKRFYE